MESFESHAPCLSHLLKKLVSVVGICSVIGSVIGIVVFPISLSVQLDGTILSLTVVALAINLIAAALMIFGVEQNRKILTVPWLSLQLNVLMFLIYSVASDPSLLYAILLVTCNVLWSIVLFYLLQDFYQRKPQDPYPPI